MPARNKALTCYPTNETTEQFDELRKYYQNKHEGSTVRVTDSYILSEIIRQKFFDVRNQETQSLTMKKVYEAVRSFGSTTDIRYAIIVEALQKIATILEEQNHVSRQPNQE